MALRVLHVLDHSIPLHSGYTFRTAALLREQGRRGWENFHLTSPKHALEAQADAGRAEEPPGVVEYGPVARPFALVPSVGGPDLGVQRGRAQLERARPMPLG